MEAGRATEESERRQPSRLNIVASARGAVRFARGAQCGTEFRKANAQKKENKADSKAETTATEVAAEIAAEDDEEEGGAAEANDQE